MGFVSLNPSYKYRMDNGSTGSPDASGSPRRRRSGIACRWIDRVGDHRFATKRWRQNMQRPDLGSRDPA
jgi:hypothetical protein